MPRSLGAADRLRVGVKKLLKIMGDQSMKRGQGNVDVSQTMAGDVSCYREARLTRKKAQDLGTNLRFSTQARNN